jgi:chorismate dehydratase
MPSFLRISAISFLNTAPLMWDFEHAGAARNFEIEYTNPSACAAELASNRADLGIIPSFAYAQIPGLVILPNIAIAAKDWVRSILLVSKKPITQTEAVAADTSSRTSVALLQVLFAKLWGGPRKLIPHPPQLEAMLAEQDAALLIGDAALTAKPAADQYVYDLAHEWRAFTGKPFVFAFWAVRLDALDRTPRGTNLTKVFQDSRNHGVQPENIAAIAKEWSERLAMTEADIRNYLTQNIDYSLDRENHAGLQLFLQYTTEIGLIPEVPQLRFLGPVAFGSARK